MSEPVKSGSWRAVPWGLVGMLCLLAAAERYVSRQGFYLLDTFDWAYVRKGYVASREAKKYDVLVFGDSQNNYGVVPRAVAGRSGRPVYNLSVVASQAPTSYFLFKRVIDSGARPSAVVVDFFPPLLSTGTKGNLRHWSSLLTLPEAATLAWWARDAELFGTVAAGVLIPSVRARAGLRDNLVSVMKGKGDVRPIQNLVCFRNWKHNDGAQLMIAPSPSQRKSDAELEKFRADYFPAMTCRPEHLAGVRAFLALAAEHGVKVYWVLQPCVPRLQEMLAGSGFDADHDAFIRSWQARFPGLVTVVDGRRAFTDLGAYSDQNHLSAPGAYAFSLALGDVLRRTLPPAGRVVGPDRWVTLPACAVGPVPEGVETVHESLAAIEAKASARR